MNIHKATADFEQWLARRLPIVRQDIALKHQHMAEAAFPFFRATCGTPGTDETFPVALRVRLHASTWWPALGSAHRIIRDVAKFTPLAQNSP